MAEQAEILYYGYSSYKFRQRMKKNILVYGYDGDVLIVQHFPKEHPTHQYYVLGIIRVTQTEGRWDEINTWYEPVSTGGGYAMPEEWVEKTKKQEII